jgi:hypothetical protein
LRNIFCFLYFLLHGHSSPEINSVKVIQWDIASLKILCYL